jgi:deoxyribodipyrimidine photolyase-related protein
MDFKKGEWCDTLDGLYWRFIEKNQKYFSSNPRLSMMTLMLKRIDKKRKERIFKLANNFIKSNTV